MATEIEVEGLQELERRLLTLEGKVVNQVVRKALREGGKIVVTSAKGKANFGKHSTGALRESLGTIARKGKGTNLQTMFVGSRAKNKAALALANARRSKPIRGIFYGHMVEKGTARGQKAQPFLRPALDENAKDVVLAFSVELKKAIDSVTRKSAT